MNDQLLTRTDVIIILGLCDGFGYELDLAELTSRNAIAVAEATSALVDRGLIESDGRTPTPRGCDLAVASEYNR